jgi:cephalosporin hydroxylase
VDVFSQFSLEGALDMRRFMEESLDMPLREVLALMQERIVDRTRYFGITTYKNPLDFWVYQEIIFETRPTVIVEIGNACGGSTLALAHLFDLLGAGRVIGVDISHAKVPAIVRAHPRVTLIEGDASAKFPDVAARISRADRVMVIEDSSHTFENTLSVLRTYSRLLKSKEFFIVEDSICRHGLPVGPSPGPYEAIEAFVGEDASFAIERQYESFLVTWNPKGFLRKK